MTQKEANEIFGSELGQQLSVIYVTSDDRAFIRFEEAALHVRGELDLNTEPLKNDVICEWYPEEEMDYPY